MCCLRRLGWRLAANGRSCASGRWLALAVDGGESPWLILRIKLASTCDQLIAADVDKRLVAYGQRRFLRSWRSMPSAVRMALPIRAIRVYLIPKLPALEGMA